MQDFKDEKGKIFLDSVKVLDNENILNGAKVLDDKIFLDGVKVLDSIDGLLADNAPVLYISFPDPGPP